MRALRTVRADAHRRRRRRHEPLQRSGDSGADIPAARTFGKCALPLPELPGNLTPAKWRRRALPWYAKPAPNSMDGFALQVSKTDLVGAVTRRIKS